MDGVLFSLAEARAAASEVSVGSEPAGLMLSLGSVAIPEMEELQLAVGGGGGGGGGTLDKGDGCSETGCWREVDAEEARWWLYEPGEGVLPGVLGWLEWLTRKTKTEIRLTEGRIQPDKHKQYMYNW